MKKKVFMAGVLAIALILGGILIGCASTPAQSDSPVEEQVEDVPVEEDVSEE